MEATSDLRLICECGRYLLNIELPGVCTCYNPKCKHYERKFTLPKFKLEPAYD